MNNIDKDLTYALQNLIAAHRIMLDGRECHISFWEQAVSQTCRRIAELGKREIEAKT